MLKGIDECVGRRELTAVRLSMLCVRRTNILKTTTETAGSSLGAGNFQHLFSLKLTSSYSISLLPLFSTSKFKIHKWAVCHLSGSKDNS